MLKERLPTYSFVIRVSFSWFVARDKPPLLSDGPGEALRPPAGNVWKSLGRNPQPALDVPPFRRNTQKSKAHETFQAHHGDLQRVELFAAQPGQNLGNAFAEGSGIRAANNPGFVFAGEANEIPICLVNLSIQGVTIEILDHTPAW